VIGKPTHMTKDGKITCCGLVGKEVHIMAYDARDVDCLRCRKTKAYKAYMGIRTNKETE